MPRLAVAYDVDGNGDQIVHVTYGQYSGRYNETQIGEEQPGRQSRPRSTRSIRVRRGRGTASPAWLRSGELSDHVGQRVVADPTQNVFMAPGIKSPLTHEFTLSYGENLFGGGVRGGHLRRPRDART